MAETTSQVSASPNPTPPPMVHVVALLVAACAVALVSAGLATGFVALVHGLEHWIWHELPHHFGWEHQPDVMVPVLLTVGAVIVMGGRRLPGHGGHSPLDSMSLDLGPREVASVAITALGSLPFGIVLGPEAPLIGIGTAVGAAAFRKDRDPRAQVLMLCGAMAAIGTVFGNPMVTSVLLAELLILAGPSVAKPPVILSALTALGAAYSLQVGIGNWAGVGEAVLAIPGLPAYPELQLSDAAAAIPLGIVVASLTVLAQITGRAVRSAASRKPDLVLLASALMVSLIALSVGWSGHGGWELILFSGQSSIKDYLAIGTVGTAIIIGLAKTAAYGVSLGSGFRGGAIFPAISVGIIFATGASHMADDFSVSALAAAGIAAGTAAATRLPFTALLMGYLLTSAAGSAVAIPAVVGVVTGMIVTIAVDSRLNLSKPDATTAETTESEPVEGAGRSHG